MTPRLVALLILLVSAGLPACQTDAPVDTAPAVTPGSALYTCPMHPQILRDAPGACPICGMDLVPVGAAPSSAGPQGVHVDPGIVQSFGVRTAPVQRQTLFKHLRTIGEIVVAEDRVSVVNLRLSGWVERLVVDRTGDPVTKGQVLLEVYSPELLSAQEELLLAVRGGGASSELARSARRKLELLGIDGRDVDAVLAAGQVRRALPIRSPVSGYVMTKDVVQGARVMAGSNLFHIADLDTIWVDASVYEFDAPWVERGQAAEMSLSYDKGTVLQGTVDTILPTLNPQSRTLRVRLVFDNPGLALKPGMFATVRIAFRRRDDVVAVPTEAILHTGTRDVVFVAVGDGHFVPREVTPGIEADHHLTEILDGLDAGEIVVVSGQFLLDSETQLQDAMVKMLAARAGQTPPEPTADTVFSCPMHPEVVEEEAGRCPKCGMFLERRPGTDEELEALRGEHVAPSHDHDGH